MTSANGRVPDFPWPPDDLVLDNLIDRVALLIAIYNEGSVSALPAVWLPGGASTAGVPVFFDPHRVGADTEAGELGPFPQTALELGETRETGQPQHVVPELACLFVGREAADHRPEECHPRWRAEVQIGVPTSLPSGSTPRRSRRAARRPSWCPRVPPTARAAARPRQGWARGMPDCPGPIPSWIGAVRHSSSPHPWRGRAAGRAVGGARRTPLWTPSCAPRPTRR